MHCTFLYPEYTNTLGSNIDIAISVITMLISLPGNFITALVIIRSETLRNEATYLLICSMCVADMLVSILAQPLFIFTMLTGTRSSCYVDNAFFVCSWAMAMASAISVICITYDRFIYISYPLKYKRKMTKKKAKIMVVIVWVISISFGCLPLFWYSEIVLQSATLLVLFSISVSLIYTYGQISCKLLFIIKTERPRTLSDLKTKNKSQKQATKTILLIVLTFFICWYPWVIVSFIVALHNTVDALETYTKDTYMMTLYWLFLSFGHSNSAFNVFIYGRNNKVLRSKIKKSLGFSREIERRVSVISTMAVRRKSKDVIKREFSVDEDLL